MKKSLLFSLIFSLFALVSFGQDVFTSENDEGKWGFVDNDGKEVIPHVYEKADCFYMGYASVVLNGKMGLIDLKGNEVVPFEYDNDLMYFEGGLAVVKKGEKFGYVDLTGKVVIEIKFDEAEDVNDGKLKVRMGEKWLFLDKEGNKIQ
ncbi:MULTISPECIES: WG repeat-containing protein [unclassified Lentimicrobium]|uniref:WG repeat-containing protein n=1 Tax=unclassified Lentimicrobium TaxID=2677434 RepID=UPI0015533018|nr:MULTISPECIES: WG repeat-containing protein [unclassified Lentimicrobium]NPD46378.1 WG repeat-containing protein [Lentimicrobium sp. S6]NPD83557.1 WG repeat-containing protein [Lentimicrobium sp. L6]NPD85954.1 WG repeat-containing protein [Lentimicrobium sp. L6]